MAGLNVPAISPIPFIGEKTDNVSMMNRFRIAFVSCVALLGVSCSRSMDMPSAQESISFSVDASSLDSRTRAEYADEPVVLTAETGDSLYLHPSEEDLGAAAMTRGALVGSTTAFHSDFRVHAYMPDGTCYIDGSKVDKYSGTTWSESVGSHMWPGNNKLSFYASAPCTLTGMSAFKADEAEGKITFSYETPHGASGKDAQSQPDLAFAYSACSKEDADGVVPLHFSHALSAVRFVANDIAGCTIKSIAIENVYSSGDCEAVPASKSYSWTVGSAVASYMQNFNVSLADSQTGEQPITHDDTYFMLVPQSVPDGAQIRIVLETLDNSTLTLTGALVGQVWQPGKLYTYSISTDSINWTYVFDVTEAISMPNGTTASNYTVRSYRYRTQNSSVREPLAWTAKITDASQSDHVFGFTYSGKDSIATYPITLERTSVRTDWDSNESHLKGQSPKGSPENPYDLATEGGTIAQTTANCYIVNAPGTYLFPLVYGNAVKNGKYNTSAYQYNGSNAFYDYNGKLITSPLVSSSGTLGDAVLVWADAFYIFKDIKIDKDKQNIIFTVDDEFMQQANAIIAVRDTEGKIMWSWHIWVTELDFSKTYSLQDYTDGTMSYEMMPASLGWIEGKRVWYDERNLAFEFTQTGTGKSKTMSVKQEGAEYQYTDGGSLYYQWGRKDPIIGLKNRSLHGAEDYRPHEVVEEKYRYRYEVNAGVSVGMTIRNPNVYYVYDSKATGTPGRWKPLNYFWDNSVGGLGSKTSTKTIYDPSPRGFKVPPGHAFSVFTNGEDGSKTGTRSLNGDQLSNGYEYEVYTRKGKTGEKVKFIATGQRVDRTGSGLGEAGGLWAMQGVYFLTCNRNNDTSSYSLCIRMESKDDDTAVTYGFVGTSSMARPVRPIKE